MPEYYKVDNRKITLREYWNIYPSAKILIPWLAGRLNLQTSLGSGFCLPESVREMEVPADEFLPQARTKLQPNLERCLQLGFHSPRYYSFENLRRDTRTSFISLLHDSGEFSVRLMHSMGTQVNPPVENQLVVLLSELSDGTYFFTSDQKAKFISAPGISGNRLIGADVARLLEAHQQSLAALRLKNPPKLTPSTEQLDELWDRYEKHSTNFGVQRGLYVRMSPEEVERERQILTGAKAMTAGNGEDADVLIELSALQNKKAGWGGAIVILLVSLGLFIGAGARQWSWEFLLILLPVLFIHELGHYLAMRAFNYRNLRMFFIPFFGAAVSGQHYNVPGWKKVIVSMMGPVPGIVLGIIVGCAGAALSEPLLTKVAIVTLILNGINLLPVLPLDGGWIFHALLFSRHYMLDGAFRVVAVIALMLAGIFSDNKILLYLGILLLFGIAPAYRMARIAATLRQRGLQPTSPDDQTIPAEVAQAIIGEVKKSLPKMYTSKMVAQQTLQIFETMNARPPSWLATLGFLFAYLVSVGLAVVFAVVFMALQRGYYE